ncbi:hypothetical protein C8J57DRAFT_1231291 [Mycena rebaudengoi]|nr:hypothetical protein C8J57DRAFT_1231291 [Mycena rebaudengoi]
MYWHEKTLGACPTLQGAFAKDLQAARRCRVNDTATPRLCRVTARVNAASMRVAAAPLVNVGVLVHRVLGVDVSMHHPGFFSNLSQGRRRLDIVHRGLIVEMRWIKGGMAVGSVAVVAVIAYMQLHHPSHRYCT